MKRTDDALVHVRTQEVGPPAAGAVPDLRDDGLVERRAGEVSGDQRLRTVRAAATKEGSVTLIALPEDLNCTRCGLPIGPRPLEIEIVSVEPCECKAALRDLRESLGDYLMHWMLASMKPRIPVEDQDRHVRAALHADEALYGTFELRHYGCGGKIIHRKATT